MRGRRIATRCAHCGLDAGPEPRESAGRVFCCAGCETVYAILHEEGLGAFYDAGGVGSLALRKPGRSAAVAPAPPPAWLASLESSGQVTLDLVGMRCASCAWLVERYLGRQPGAVRVDASYATATCTVRWDPGRTSLGALLKALERIGYRGRPADPRLRARQGEREARVLLVRTGLSLLLAMNVMLASLGLYVGELQGIAPAAREVLRGIAGALAAPVVFWGGWPFLRGALTALRARRATMDTLVSLGALSAFGASLVGLARGGHVYFDSSAMIVALILVGRAIEQAARRKGMQSIRALLALEPTSARLAGEASETTIDAGDLEVGQVVEVRPGERFPCDGTVVSGTSEADESLLTGESHPRPLTEGAPVHGGALNGWGVLRVRAERVGSETAVGRIVAAVERALASKAPIERLADRAMGIFVPAVLVLAAAATLGWWVAAGDLGRAVMIGVAVVVIACPCALGLATPAALVVALGTAARRGIFFRDGAALERAAGIRRVAFDKTGTLTDGRLAIIGIHPAGGWTADEMLRYAAAAERSSEHALARAVVAAAEVRGLALPEAGAFRAVAGAGVEATVEGRKVLVGSAAFIAGRGVEIQSYGTDGTVAAVAVDGSLAGYLAAADATRPEARAAVQRLAELGIASALVSGDRAGPVALAADATGVPPDATWHELSPDGKASLFEKWRGEGMPAAMVGDGVNDAPALAAADVGIALGTGTDVALETADVALSTADLTLVPAAFVIARRTRRIVRQNLAWAIGYNVAALPLAMAGTVHPAIAAAAMAFSSVSVLLNALRARSGPRGDRGN